MKTIEELVKELQNTKINDTKRIEELVKKIKEMEG